MNISLDRDALTMAQVVEIRARRDHNRLLGTYDPVRRMLRLFHRGETITLQIAELEATPVEPATNGKHLT